MREQSSTNNGVEQVTQIDGVKATNEGVEVQNERGNLYPFMYSASSPPPFLSEVN